MSVTKAVTRGIDRSVQLVERVNGYVERHGVRQGLDLAVRARPGRAGVRDMAWSGYPKPLRLRMDGGSDIATFDEVIVDECYALPFEADLRHIVDAGANIGFTSAYLAKRYPDAVIVSIEPDPQNFDLLVQNTSPFPNVHPIRAALWTESGTVRLGDPNAGPRGYRVDERVAKGFDVPAMDVPSIMRRFDMERIDLLKVDVEGAEIEIFDHSQDWIDSVDAIAVELHDRFRPGCSRSFFRAVSDFPQEWLRGETTFVRRAD